MSNRETSDVQAPAMLAVGQRPDVLVMRMQSGLFRAYDDPRRVVRVGVPGMADAMMVVAVEITPAMVGQTVGVAVAAEFKMPGRGQRGPQERWQRAFELRGGVYRVIRSAEEMIDLVELVKASRRKL